jgi:hypothetical protein
MILLIVVGYLLITNTLNVFTVQRLTSPMIPKSTLKDISRAHLHFAIVLALCLIVASFLYKRGKYTISIAVCLVVVVLLNYFPGWFV